MSKRLIFGKEARDILLKGSELIAQAVGTTLGPRGRNVAIDREWGVPRVVHDGVTVAKAVDDNDRAVKMGIDIAKDAASRTNDQAGDGTTTAILMTHAIFSHALEHIVAGSSPMMLRKGITKAVDAVDDELVRMAKPVETKEETMQVAKISAQDELIGNLVYQAIDKVGEGGVVTYEKVAGDDITVEYKEGMQFDKGIVNPYLVSNPITGESTIENGHIIVTDYEIQNSVLVVKMLERIIEATNKTKFVIIAKDFKMPAFNDLMQNHVQGAINVQLIKAPYSGERQGEVLEDIATYTGATFISEARGMKFDDVTVEHMGTAKKVVSSFSQYDRGNTVIMGGQPKDGVVADRIAYLDTLIADKKTDEFNRAYYQERKAKLTSGIAVIRVGGHSDTEQDEQLERVVDAVSATRAAREQGIVPGGETALLRAADVLTKLIEEETDHEVRMGIEIVRKACQQPFRKLMDNAGIDPGMALTKVQEVAAPYGFNAVSQQVENLIEAGIIDPVKVTRSALRNAASAATMMMTTDTLVVEDKDKDAQ